MRRFWLLLLLMALWPAPSLGQSFNLPNPPELKILKVNFDKITTNCAESTDGENQECEVFVPWLGNFVSQMYVFAVGLSGIAATIMIMVGGFLWLTAGGNNSQIENAKRYISSALLGLSLMLGSYVILYNVNPKLVRFDALSLKYARPKEVETELKAFACEFVPRTDAGGCPNSLRLDATGGSCDPTADKGDNTICCCPNFNYQLPQIAFQQPHTHASVSKILSCVQSKLPIVITSISDSDLGDKCKPWEQTETYKDDNNCVHSQNSWHYGGSGTNRVKYGNYQGFSCAADIDDAGLDFNKFRDTVNECKMQLNIEIIELDDEGNHYHFATGACR